MSFSRLIHHIRTNIHPVYSFLDYHDSDWMTFLPSALSRGLHSRRKICETTDMILELRTWSASTPVFETAANLIFTKRLQGKASIDIQPSYFYNILPYPYFVTIPEKALWKLNMTRDSVTLHLYKK